jgi:CDP-diacylglycerol--glycerol-3-phosphate 3-phosphatidyltransferase
VTDLNESPLREVFGIHHMKFYIFDNDVIITGANLSEDYFTTRQDRYFIIKNAPELANYICDLLGIYNYFSYFKIVF